MMAKYDIHSVYVVATKSEITPEKERRKKINYRGIKITKFNIFFLPLSQ